MPCWKLLEVWMTLPANITVWTAGLPCASSRLISHGKGLSQSFVEIHSADVWFLNVDSMSTNIKIHRDFLDLFVRNISKHFSNTSPWKQSERNNDVWVTSVFLQQIIRVTHLISTQACSRMPAAREKMPWLEEEVSLVKYPTWAGFIKRQLTS